jgi:beta-ureidopropionase / N-carbamoyl-L-amino-acid hydrolase
MVRRGESMMSTTNLPLSGARLWDSLMELAKIGGTPKGGCNRQTLTDLDSEGRHLLRRWGEAIGCTLTVDRLGNMVLRREGRDPDAEAGRHGQPFGYATNGRKV